MVETFDLDEIHAFEWDLRKCEANLVKHGIDFADASEIFYGPTLLRRSDREGEERWIVIGALYRELIAVVFTPRGKAIRIISARRARKNEKRAYRNAKVG